MCLYIQGCTISKVDRVPREYSFDIESHHPQVPIGSDAELRMQRQLQDLERKTREMRGSMERIAAKERYQMRQIDDENHRRSADKATKWR